LTFLLTQKHKNRQKVRKTPHFEVKCGVFGGDKRDRVADLLNAIAPEEVTHWKNIDKTDVFDV